MAKQTNTNQNKLKHRHHSFWHEIRSFFGWEKKHQSLGFQHGQIYLSYARRDIPTSLRHLRVKQDGLTHAEVHYKLKLYGPNVVVREKKPTWHYQLVKTFFNPFIALLSILAVISFFTDDVAGGFIMAFMVLTSTTLTFIQEYRSSKAAESLKSLVSTKATVLRKEELPREHSDDRSYVAQYRSLTEEVVIEEIVQGDIVHLSAGDMIPADLRLLTAKDLFITQAALTGESLPLEKSIEPESDSIKNPLEAKNLCFMGSVVVSGTATSVVLETGSKTFLGSIASQLQDTEEVTSFDEGIKKFTWLMLKIMFVMVPLVFFINGFSKGNWLDAFLFAVAVAVGLTPEMLPMIVTVNLAKGALAMSKERVIVKRMHAIQNFGAMDVLCTDKTGTLTEDKVILEKYVGPLGEEKSSVLTFAYLNSFHQTGLRNLLDIAVIERMEKQGGLSSESRYKKVDEIPFDFQRRRMSVVVEEESSAHHLLICKGALEEIFKISSRIEIANGTSEITPEIKEKSLSIARTMNEEGLRVIAVGYRRFEKPEAIYSQVHESDLTLQGFIAFLDPPKETAAQAIRALNEQGVKVKVLTGDNDIVARNVCRQVGIPSERVVLGHELEQMSEEELMRVSEEVFIFAKLSPAQKQRLVKAMHSNGHVVGFLGDGINDSPALKAADVGISVDTAVDIAKESSSIILLEKNLLVLEKGVQEGRKVFGNIIKYIRMGASSNFGNVFSLIGASIFLPFLPMLPVQLLVQNLLYDLSQTAIPLDRVDPEFLSKPRKWEIGNVKRFMFWFGPVSSLFDYVTFGILWFVFKAKTPEHQSLFQSGWFVEGLLSQTLIVHFVRTAKIPFIESRPALALLGTTLLIMGIGIYIPFSPFAHKLGMQALPHGYFPWLIAILISYAVLAQIVKMSFIKRFGYG